MKRLSSPPCSRRCRFRGRVGGHRPGRVAVRRLRRHQPVVTETADGVHFGPYANGRRRRRARCSTRARTGSRCSQITRPGFSENHSSSDDSPIAAPYLRIFLNNDADDVIFDATRRGTVVPPETG